MSLCHSSLFVFLIQHNPSSLFIISAMHADLCTNTMHNYKPTYCTDTIDVLCPNVLTGDMGYPLYALSLFFLALSGKAHLIRWWLIIVIFFKSNTIWLGGSLNKLAVVVGVKKESVGDLFISGSRFLPAVASLDNTLSLVCQFIGIPETSHPYTSDTIQYSPALYAIAFFVSVGFTTSCRR